ncbi:hypothetical protein OG698_47345 [Streptomyces sp. NBC_01003]|nr:hypothetical protein OG698_47345 [Streptomyces sp. NBC_01003]
MEVPQSAWTVWGTIPLHSMVSRINPSARSAASASSTVCPMMQRLKMSVIT